MSIFGSRKKTTVGTSVGRVIEDNILPNSIKTGATQAILNNSSQSVEYAMDELADGLAMKVNRMYRYARDHYTNGLPQGTTYSSITGRTVVEQAVESDVGPVNDITYYHLGAANLLHIGWTLLVSQYGYDSNANSLIVDGNTVYLSNMQPVVVESTMAELENGSMDQWGVLPNAGYTPKKAQLSGISGLQKPPAFLVDPGAAADYLRVEYCWQVDETKTVEGVAITSKVIKEGVLNLAIPMINEGASYFHVRFIQGGKAGYWMYQLNSNEKPQVDAVFDAAPNTIGTFYPWTYFRFDKKPITDNKTTDEYKTSTKMLKRIGMDLEEVTNTIHENPDIKDVEQAMMMFAVPANAKSEIERRYLYDFFDKMHTSAQVHGGTAPNKQLGMLGMKFSVPVNETTIVIKDKKFKMALSFTSIIKRRVSGVQAEAGEHDSIEAVDRFNKKIETIGGMELEWSTDVQNHVYRRQITENVYDEIAVIGLKMTYWIWGDYTDTADENEPALLVPLDYEIVEQYQMIDREALYGRSMHYIFNSRIVTKLKWYQTGIFRVFMVVVAIVVTIISYGTTIKGLIAAIAAGGAAATAAYYAIAGFIMKYLLATVLVKLFVKVVGAKVAFIVAILAAVTGFYQAIEAGSIAGAPWAKELLSIASNLSGGASDGFKSEFKDLLSEVSNFQKEMETKEKLLSDAQELLEGTNHLTPMLIWGETPDEFYQRTVHSGNIGVVGLDAVSSFVQMKLTLPKLSDSLGEFV